MKNMAFMISVRVDNLVKHFGETLALNHIDLEIQPGELFFLLGPSGCGKTTLLRSLAGFYIPEEGSIFFGEQEVTRLEPHKRNTGMMFQSYALWPHMTIRDNVSFGLQQRGVARDEIRRRTDEALESIRMLPYAERKPNQLSGGQQQRIALARALVIRPQCLLLDEPLSNLDAKLRHEMRGEIRRVCKEFKLTTVYVTHDQKEALSIADRMAVMKDGNILQVGSPLEVYKRPRNRFVADFIGDTNFMEGRIVEVTDQGCRVETPVGALEGVAADAAWELRPGEPVVVCLRPETIRLREKAPAANGFQGRLADSVYYGEVAHYTMEAAGLHLQVAELNPRHVGAQPDEVLFAEVEPEDVVILREPSAVEAATATGEKRSA